MKNRGILRATIVVALASSLALAACRGSLVEDTCFCDAPGDASYSNPDLVDAAYSSTYSPLLLENDLCFPNALPTNGGLVDCHVVLFFPDAGSCASLGFSIASSADFINLVDQAVDNGVQFPDGALCALDQLPANACLADAGPGWCYEPGGCGADAGCAQSLCASSGYSPEAGTTTWLVCP